MARLALLSVWIVLGVSSARAADGETSSVLDSSANGSQENSEIFRLDDEAIEEFNERRRREAPKTENSNSQFIRSEKTTPEGNIIWRDNSETRKQGHVPTVTRVLHHGIYPSLNITEPLYGSNIGKYRQKRAEGSQNALDRNSELPTMTGTVSTNSLPDGWETVEPSTDETSSTRGNMAEETQQYSRTHEIRTPYPTPTYSSRRERIGGNHYLRADHSQDSFNNRYNVDPYVPRDYAQGSIRYRTAYYPSNSEYQGDPENKGHVKLISVGYYSVNESTADLRSYRNPKVERNVSGKHRVKRDNHWCWLDKFFKSVWTPRNPETKEEENEIPGSEPMKVEVSEVNEEARGVYGYSSNGNGHQHAVDGIYLVRNDQTRNPLPQNPYPEETASATSTLPPTPQEHTTPEGIRLPDRPVLIQAPNRIHVVCRPPKRLARGRCRTVW